MYKNLPKQVALQLKDLVQYQPGQVVSRILVQNDRVSMTLFSFDQGEEISAHASGGDAMVNLSGFESTEWRITMNPHTSVMCYYSRESCGQGHVLTLPMEGQP